MDVAWVLDDPGAPGAEALLAHARAAGLSEGGDGPDVVVAVGAQSARRALLTPAARHVLALDALPPTGLVLDLPMAFLALRPHVAEALAELRPDAPRRMVRLGLPTGAADTSPMASSDSPLRVLAPDERAHTIVATMREARRLVELVEDADVLVLGEHPGPLGPLPAFAAGAACVAPDGQGVDEHVEHGVSGLVHDRDDLRGAARQLDLLARDRELLSTLRAGAIATAESWPRLDEAAPALREALEALAATPPPDLATAAARMLAGGRALEEAVARAERDRDTALARLAPLERLAARPALRRALDSRAGRALLGR